MHPRISIRGFVSRSVGRSVIGIGFSSAGRRNRIRDFWKSSWAASSPRLSCEMGCVFVSFGGSNPLGAFGTMYLCHPCLLLTFLAAQLQKLHSSSQNSRQDQDQGIYKGRGTVLKSSDAYNDVIDRGDSVQ